MFLHRYSLAAGGGAHCRCVRVFKANTSCPPLLGVWTLTTFSTSPVRARPLEAPTARCDSRGCPVDARLRPHDEGAGRISSTSLLQLTGVERLPRAKNEIWHPVRSQSCGRLGEEYRPAPSTRDRRRPSTWQPWLSSWPSEPHLTSSWTATERNPLRGRFSGEAVFP